MFPYPCVSADALLVRAPPPFLSASEPPDLPVVLPPFPLGHPSSRLALRLLCGVGACGGGPYPACHGYDFGPQSLPPAARWKVLSVSQFLDAALSPGCQHLDSVASWLLPLSLRAAAAQPHSPACRVSSCLLWIIIACFLSKMSLVIVLLSIGVYHRWFLTALIKHLIPGSLGFDPFELL